MSNSISRNDPCPCGSGRKYKRCCQAKDEAAEREDVIESALESALEQSAEIVVIREAGEQIEALGSIGAVLRF